MRPHRKLDSHTPSIARCQYSSISRTTAKAGARTGSRTSASSAASDRRSRRAVRRCGGIWKFDSTKKNRRGGLGQVKEEGRRKKEEGRTPRARSQKRRPRYL